MKALLFIYLISFPWMVVGQKNISKKKVKILTEKNPNYKFFLDSMEIDIKHFWLDPYNIKDITVTPNQNTSDKYVADVQIISKDKKRVWLNLMELPEKNLKKGTSQLIVIDGIVISELSSVRLEASAVKSLVILKNADSSISLCRLFDQTLIISTKVNRYRKKRL
jgi:hypothetical protein